MRCSVCDKELKVAGQERLETLCEHVSNSKVSLKDRYECVNAACPAANGSHCWNVYGEYYFLGDYVDRKGVPFIDGLMSARGSLSRRLERENGENDETHRMRIPSGRWKGWTKVWKMVYTADDDGNVLTRKRVIQWVTPEGVYYVSPWSMLRFSLGRLWTARKNNWGYRRALVEKAKDATYARAEWWRKVMAVIAKVLLRLDPKAWK